MCTYLAKRNATYYFRRLIPVELRQFMDGRSEIMVSLRTKDRDQAKRLIPAQTAASERLLDEARAQLVSSDESAPGTPERPSVRDATWERTQMEYEENATAFREEMAVRDDAALKAADALEARLQGGVDLSPDDEAAEFLIRHYRDDRDRYRDRYKARKRRDVSKPFTETKLAPAEQGKGIMLDTTISDLWAAERQPQAKTLHAYRATGRRFHERVGNVSVEQITRKHVRPSRMRLLRKGNHRLT